MIRWSSTVKTVEKSNFFLQLPLIWKRFWPQLVVFSVMMVCPLPRPPRLHVLMVQAAMIVFAVVPQIPPGWRINNLEVIFPMALLGGSHLLYPFALNPWFLSFSVRLVFSGPFGLAGKQDIVRLSCGRG